MTDAPPQFDPEAFAREWIEAWNARDIERVIAHFAPDAEFRSPRAFEVTGHPVVRGHAAMRAYWESGAGRVDHLRFTLDRVIWDGVERLAIVYDSEVGDRHRRACEFYTIDRATGLALRGEAMFGAERG